MKTIYITDDLHKTIRIEAIHQGKKLQILVDEILRKGLGIVPAQDYDPSEFAEDEDETLEDEAAI